ncbi:serine/threonine-protein kinase ATR isoform X1 [Vespa crabro]|uniref:serine/threonine-protein kinase ATR isoform X1 n=1 Tax=Vespa crabro TaxID=7445 RepID=UPI001F010F6E|nr:serine/threonine-protein kinase ATR isoform X1 [Vespa crabro]
MDEDDSLPEYQENTSVAESLWKFIHCPVTTIFSDYKSVTAEQILCSLLESILKSSLNLRNVLIPPYNVIPYDDNLYVQYEAFTTWLFGAMFYIIGNPLSNDVLMKSIEVQACMLRILSAHHSITFTKISMIYLSILEELNGFYVHAKENDEIILRNFIIIDNCIPDLDLSTYPVTLKINLVTSVQRSILEIINKSGISTWDQEKLGNIFIGTIIKSAPDIKLNILELSPQLIEICNSTNQYASTLIIYTTEIIKTIPIWINYGQLTIEALNQYIKTLLQLIHMLVASTNLTTLCFEIINLLEHEFILAEVEQEALKPLKIEICQKIKEYLILEPRSCTSFEAKKFIKYFRNCPEFISVFMCYIYFGIRYNDSITNNVNLEEVNEAWFLFKQELHAAVQTNRYNDMLYILHGSCLLQHWIIEQNIDVILYKDDLNVILKKLIYELNFGKHELKEIILRSIMCVMIHNESNKDLIESILTLPFMKNIKETAEINQTGMETLKSLNNEMKAKCFMTICGHGKKENRLYLIRTFIINNELQLAIIGINSSITLMKNSKIKLEDISEFILKPALFSTNELIQETLAKTLGHIACFLSGGFDVVRDIAQIISNNIECKYCTKSVNNFDKDKYLESCFIDKQHDQLLSQYFKLLTSRSPKVRLSLSKNFMSFTKHMKSFSSNTITQLWLPYMQDENVEIRSNFAITIGQVLNIRIDILKRTGECLLDRIPTELEKFVDFVINFMVETLIVALDTSNYCLHNTLLNAAKNFACVPLYVTERRIINLLFVTILHPNSSPANVASAVVIYQDIASFLNITPKMLYIRYKKFFLTLIMQRAVFNYLESSYNIATSVHRVAKCVGYHGSRELLRKDGYHAVCYLLSLILQTPKVICLLQDMAELLSVDEKQMLIEYFPHICSYSFLNLPLSTGIECLKYVSKLTKISISELTRDSFVGIFEDLMLKFYESPEKIIGFLRIISDYDGTTRPDFSTHERIVAYLKLRLHGILVKYDVNLGPKSDEYTQKCALASLSTLMRYMGAEHVAPLRYKILATLRVSLGFKRPTFGPLVCDAWDAFIHNMPMEDLGPLLPTICVSMIPLLENYSIKVNEMLEFLFHENNNISKYISDLFFIDDMKVSSHISAIVKKHILEAQPCEFGKNLKLWLKRITHETDEVRMRALVYLQKFLAEHRIELNKMILSDTDVHPLIVELLDTLLMGCQEKDDNIRILYGECLGELGAIEPSLLPRRIISREDSKFIFDMNEEFACAMLFENVRAFQMQNSTQSMDCFSLAIQEILKAYDIRPEGKNSELWNNLPLTTQQIIFPFLTSHYKITVVNDIIEFPHPVYGSEAGSSVGKWAYNWLCSMSNNLNHETLSNVLHACRPAFKRDIKTMIFALPHIVSYIVSNETEEIHNKLREEILAVINVRIQPTLDQELVNYRPLRYDYSTKIDDKRISDEARRTRCSQIVFSILDHLQRWLRERRLFQDEKFKSVETFCSKLDTLVIAEGCYQSHEYHRALMYLEQHMASSGKGLSETTEGGLLAKIYAQLDEPDGVSGILATQDQTPTLQQLVLAHEVSGQLQDAATCYERLAQKEVVKSKYLQGMIHCYLGLDQPFTAKNITEGILSSRPELEPLIIDNEPFWRLAQVTHLDNASQKNIKDMLLEDFERGIKPDFSIIKKKLLSLLEVASRPGGYQQTYSCIMKLHVLNEFDKAASLMMTDVKQVPLILEEWDKRGQLIRTSRGIEFVLGMRRATLDLAVKLQAKTSGTENLELKREIGKIWLKSAKIARKAGLHQQSYMYILSAGDSCPSQELYIEQAQLYWQKGCQEEAFTTLKRCFSNCFKPSSFYKQMPSGECVEERKQCAKAKLLFAKYNDETLNVDTDVSICNYKEAIEVWRAWEKSLLACAQYYESVVNRMSDEEKDIKGRELQVHMMNYYGKSLQYGCKYIHQSMPKMLTIWLDFASRVATRSSQYGQVENDKLRQDCLLKMTKIMDAYQERLPIFMWLTAFSQLVSRICHPSVEVQKTLCTLLVKLIVAYPQHCLWMMASVINSSYPIRQRRCQEILNHSQLKTLEMTKLIKDFNKLWEKLIELSNKNIPDGIMNTTVSQLSRNLPRMFSNTDFSPIMIPATKFRQFILPSKDTSVEHHHPFSSECVHIAGIEEKVVVMQSLQRPRRIELKGSDGKKYLFMCKPKDDLRRDFRLMEFNDIVNKYLQKDPESRQRRLYIRTYSVVPLNEECGFIEWVPNLVGFRPILMNLYRERGIAITSRELKSLLCSLKDPLEKKRYIFLNKLLPRHPPVLGDWFRLTFPDPYGWYEARTAYIRTTAVMSMVGYILGLGDRHGENILFDSKCGDCVHVDFSCLFNRGELLDWPERVPFRLTHNMVDAMGPLKVEGPFRRACQITMRVLRQRSSTLLSVLTPFVYDPLVSWNKNQVGEAGEKTNEKAVEHIKNIEQRLKGLVRSQGKKLENIALNLSVEGQTNHLILEAMNIDNLCQMYFGWGAYM